MIDLDDTSRCGGPGMRCESCGAAGELALATADTALGVLCLTLCARCARSGQLPGCSAPTVVRLVLTHCEHLGIDVDQMAAAMELE